MRWRGDESYVVDSPLFITCGDALQRHGTMAQPTQQAEILAVRNLSPQVRELVVKPLEHPIAFKPGQWVSLHLPVGTKPPLVRAYTMAEPESASGELVLAFDRVPDGVGSGYLWSLGTGDRVPLAGPVGTFVLPEPVAKDLLFIARYTGIVPIRCMIRDLMRRGFERPVTLVYLSPSEEELIYHEELEALGRADRSFTYLHLVSACDPGSPGAEAEAVIARLKGLDGGRRDLAPMICGVKAFVRPIRGFFTEMGYERKAVRVETYD